MKETRRRRNKKLWDKINRGNDRDEKVDAAAKEERRKKVFRWSPKKKRRWCEKHGNT